MKTQENKILSMKETIETTQKRNNDTHNKRMALNHTSGHDIDKLAMGVAIKNHFEPQPDIHEALQRVKARCQTKPKRQFNLWIAAVACCIFCIGFAALYFLQQATPQQRAMAYEKKLNEMGLSGKAKIQTLDMKNDATIPQHLLHKDEKGEWTLNYKKALAQGMTVSKEIETNSVTMPQGKDMKIVLADGTEVWLHANSKLIYPTAFPSNERRVYLQGEAYFRVAQNKQQPFVVYTDRMCAKVLGTELNVRSYTQEPPQVVLITGAVEVENVKSGEKVSLSPGQYAQVDEEQLMVKPSEHIEKYIYWRNGYMLFEDAKLADIAHALSQWYHIEVVFDTPSLQEIQLRFLFYRNDRIERTIDLLNAYGLFRVYIKDGIVHVSE